jgi:hypothetical protein
LNALCADEIKEFVDETFNDSLQTQDSTGGGEYTIEFKEDTMVMTFDLSGVDMGY